MISLNTILNNIKNKKGQFYYDAFQKLSNYDDTNTIYSKNKYILELFRLYLNNNNNRKLHTEVYSRWEMMNHHLPSITQTDEISLHNLAQSESKIQIFTKIRFRTFTCVIGY